MKRPFFKGISQEAFDLGKVLFAVASNRFQGTVKIDLRTAGCCGVKISQPPGEGFDFSASDLTGLQLPHHRARLRQLPHLHGMLDRHAGASQRKSVVIVCDRHDPQIDPAGETPIQIGFLSAEVMAFLEAAVIDKPQVDLFFDFVNEFSSQKNP